MISSRTLTMFRCGHFYEPFGNADSSPIGANSISGDERFKIQVDVKRSSSHWGIVPVSRTEIRMFESRRAMDRSRKIGDDGSRKHTRRLRQYSLHYG